MLGYSARKSRFSLRLSDAVAVVSLPTCFGRMAGPRSYKGTKYVTLFLFTCLCFAFKNLFVFLNVRTHLLTPSLIFPMSTSGDHQLALSIYELSFPNFYFSVPPGSEPIRHLSFLPDLFHLAQCARGLSICCIGQDVIYLFFLVWLNSNLSCIYTTSFTRQWTPRSFPCPAYCKQRRREHAVAGIFSS